VRAAPARGQRTDEERDRLVEQFLPLVRYVVARLPVTMPATLDKEEMFSVGVLGLLHAASSYDPGRGASFKTFAYTAIRGAILDEIRRHDPVPRGRRDQLRRIERAAGALRARLDREPSLEELAEHLGVPATDLDADLLALQTCRILSLDDSLPGADPDGGTLIGRFADPDAVEPDARLLQQERLTLLARAVSELPPTERHVVVLYHYENLYLKEIGAILGVTESRVSQILSRATARLRARMQSLERDPREEPDAD
jgi:RNA polymerase sigma factor for flagellar operon FliA